MWVTKAHYAILVQSIKDVREVGKERLADRDAIIAQQQKQIVAIEEERRELSRALVGLISKPKMVSATPPDATPDSWEAIMEAEIKSLRDAEKEQK